MDWTDQAIVLGADPLHDLVEVRFLVAAHEERRVHDHAVADDFVAATRDRDRLERIAYLSDVDFIRRAQRHQIAAAKIEPSDPTANADPFTFGAGSTVTRRPSVTGNSLLVDQS